MIINSIGPGRNIPDDINVVIEIPAYSDPVKYEMDKKTGTLVVNRFMATAMFYPCNYGYIPQTLASDRDPVDVLVITPFPILSSSVIQCRPIGILKMKDEAGDDNKILAVPNDNLTDLYHDIKSYQDMSETLLHSIRHFFEHYKELEAGKWVKVEGWFGPKDAKQEITDGVRRYKS